MPVKKRIVRCQDKVKLKIDQNQTIVDTISNVDDKKNGNSQLVNDVIDSSKSSASSSNDSPIFRKQEEKSEQHNEERQQTPDFFNKIKENFKDTIEDIHRVLIKLLNTIFQKEPSTLNK